MVDSSNYNSVKAAVIRSPVTYIITLFLTTIDIIILIVGYVEYDKCPLDARVPVYLILQGCFGVAGKLLPIINIKLCSRLFYYLAWTCYALSLGVLLAASTVIYRIGNPNFAEEHGLYCSKPAYFLGFFYVIIHWILLTILACSVCCFFANTSEAKPKQLAIEYPSNNTNSYSININISDKVIAKSNVIKY